MTTNKSMYFGNTICLFDSFVVLDNYNSIFVCHYSIFALSFVKCFISQLNMLPHTTVSAKTHES